jgi:hypothetical protein
MTLPLYQIQVLPGVKELPPGVVPPGRFVAHWTIDLPSGDRTPQGKIASVEQFGTIGRIERGEWLLVPSPPLDRTPPLVLFDLAPGAGLIIDTAGYSVSRLSLYRYGVPEPYQLTNSSNMTVSYPPAALPNASNENIIEVLATTTVAAVPANPNRLGGYIENRANKSMWVKWGASTTASPLTAALPYTEVPSKGQVAIESGFIGEISLIWSAGVTASLKAYVHEMVE